MVIISHDYTKVVISVNRDIDNIIRAKQFDAGMRFLSVSLVHDGGVPVDLTDCTVRFNAQKPDGATIFNNATIEDAKNGAFLIELTDQTLSIGDAVIVADISVFSNDAKHILTTRKFQIQVQSTVRNDEAIESSNEFGAVVTLFQDVWDLRVTIESINNRFGELSHNLASGEEVVGSSALGGLNRIWNYLKTQSTAAIVETVKGIESVIGVANPGVSDTSSIMNYLRKISGQSVIKSVQRGLLNTTASNVITLADVTPAKCHVTLQSTIVAMVSNYGLEVRQSIVSSLTATTLHVTPHTISVNGTTTYGTIAWEVIEFY